MTIANDPQARLRSIDAMFNPRSIAVVGATEKPGYGGRLFTNLLNTGSTATLYPVNPNRSEVLGIPAFRSPADLPEPVDLATIVVPSADVVATFRSVAERGAKSALIVSAGFAELATDEGRARQAELRAIARQYGTRLCGPNCLGFANVAGNSWTTPSSRIAPQMKDLDPRVALVSQSGATAYRPLMGMALDRGIGFRYMIATGNEADLESTDFIEYMLRDPEVCAIMAVVESFKDGPRFIDVAEQALEAGKPIVLLKIGRTEAGARGAASHTAAMTGSDDVQDALFRQKGVIRVDDYDELIETAAMFRDRKVPKGKRVGAISESGGMGSFLADRCAGEGLEVPVLSDATRDKLLAIMGERGSAANPADLTQFGNGPEFATILDILLAEEQQQDLIIINSVGLANQADIVMAATQKTDKPILFIWAESSTAQNRDYDALARLRQSDVPLFYTPGGAAKAGRRLVAYHHTRDQWLAEKASKVAPLRQDIETVRALVRESAAATLNERQSKQALAAYGVGGVGDRFCADRAEALRAADLIGYPVALKIVSEQIPHKTEAGGVRLGIADAKALAEAYDAMMQSVAAYDPKARTEGVLVQKMASGGIELIVGVSRDEQFGPVLMLGLGGVLAEALEAVTWRVCPVNRREAREMIGEVRGLSRLLAGFRGSPKADEGALVDALVAVSRLAVDAADEIASLDINPLSVLPEGQGAIALDALVVPVHRTAEERRKAG
ncbi:acetate--CoA ligase family protein [Pseudochelatococcus sp. B33]